DIQNAYRQYTLNSAAQQIFRGESDDYFINARDMNPVGIDWTVVSAVPLSIFVVDIDAGMAKAGIVAAVSMLLAIAIYSLFMRRTLKPMHTLMTVTNDLSAGNLSSRVDIVRDDELGMISQGVNSVADKMQSLVENLESIVDQRTQELQSAFQALGETKDKLLLILDTAAEGIYGINLEGACTFCNTSCVKMLGYGEYKDLLHHNMHELIHYAREDGSPLPENECKIHLALSRGEKVHVDDEVFWRADGSPISVEYYSYPQIKDGRVIGAVITFMDIGERKKREAQIHYLSCYDPLTGLHNRRCFDENRVLIDTESNLPLSVIFADLNGLKMTNDIFGHAAGDELIRVSSEILKSACRQEDLIARIGGDEFIILLPKTNAGSAMKVLARIRAGFADVQVKAVKGSISLGLSTKTGADQPLDEVMANAENAMYKDKSVNRKNNSKDMINTIIDTLHTKNPREKRHSLAVADLSERIGSAMNLPDDQLVKLRQAGYLHDIGKIILDDSILAKDTFTAEEIDAIRQHPAAGYRILSLFDDMLDIAEFVYAHHERWDGTGFPRGIKGEQMPLISRIIAVAEVYDRVAHKGGLQPEGFEESGLEAIRKGAGKQFDAKVAEAFLRIMEDQEEEV
ncbi:MAG: diguanylate cyclase, partial [Clostridia bacterium]|nr:diguanylate cyclase [Clostridia bacterium]